MDHSRIEGKQTNTEAIYQKFPKKFYDAGHQQIENYVSHEMSLVITGVPHSIISILNTFNPVAYVVNHRFQHVWYC